MSVAQMMRVTALTFAGALVLLISMVYSVGTILPVAHVAAARGEFPAARKRVWQVITDWQQYPKWRSGVTAVEVLSAEGESASWVEVDTRGDSLKLKAVEIDAPYRLVTSVGGDEDAPIAGTWTFALDDDGPGTYLRIVEEAEVHDPLFRFVAAVFTGHTLTMDTYLSDLRQYLEDAD